MRLGIDVRYLSHGLIGGVHTYVANFVPALIALAPEHQIFLYADTKRPFELSSLPKHVTVRYLPWRNRLSSLYHDLFMQRVMNRDRLDVVHFPANYGFGPRTARTVVTLHDEVNVLPWTRIIRSHKKNLWTFSMMTYLHLCTRMALNSAHWLLTVSDYSRRQIVRHSRFDPQKITTIPLAPPADLSQTTNPQTWDGLRQRYGLTKPFVLADAYKNPEVLIRAWQRLPLGLSAEREMVFFSRTSNPSPAVHDAVRAGLARLIIRPAWEDLLMLYSQAEAFVFPSLFEGFGLPVLEAMACGTPLIASNRCSIPEVVGQSALLIDPEDDKTLACYLLRLLTSPSEAQRLRKLSYARAAQFSWTSTARQILKCYQRVVETTPAWTTR